MYQKKKIGLFVSHIYGEYQKNLCRGVIQKAAEYGYRTEIYATNDGEDLGTYANGEESVLHIPNFDDLEGVIFASGTYSQKSLSEQLHQLLLKQKDLTVVEITEAPTDFASVRMENNHTAGQLTEHLITEHGAKRIAYLGFGNDNPYSLARQASYKATMEKHHLTVGPQDIFLLDDSDRFNEALDFFTDNDSPKLDGIICYNDEVALALWACSYEKGYQIPNDFAITGCDCSEAGQNLNPTLTTVTFPSYEIGLASVDLLLKQKKEKSSEIVSVIAEPVFGGSCGCDPQTTEPSFKYPRSLEKRVAALESSMFASMKMSADFSHITDLEDGMDLLEQYLVKLPNCREFYVCLYDNWDSITQTEFLPDLNSDDEPKNESTIQLVLAIKNGKRLPNCSFTKKSLLPDFIQKDSDSSYLVCPLFFEDREFGYVAIAFENNNLDFRLQHVHWVMNITQFLQNMCEAKHTQILAKHLEDIYLKDVLTGLYNHHGFIQQQAELISTLQPNDGLYALLMDLDCLKTINDHFGHQEGDFAIKVIGQAIQQALAEHDIAARFSGDEFYILLKAASQDRDQDFITNVSTYLDNFNKLSSKPYIISFSAGSSHISFSENLSDSDMNNAFDAADEKMYETKRKKKKEVLR